MRMTTAREPARHYSAVNREKSSIRPFYRNNDPFGLQLDNIITPHADYNLPLYILYIIRPLIMSKHLVTIREGKHSNHEVRVSARQLYPKFPNSKKSLEKHMLPAMLYGTNICDELWS